VPHEVGVAAYALSFLCFCELKSLRRDCLLCIGEGGREGGGDITNQCAVSVLLASRRRRPPCEPVHADGGVYMFFAQ